MANRNKFEEMLERLVNEDREGAEELFHEIVVERSREIYETLLAEEAEEDLDETTDEEVDESEEDELDESEDDDLEESEDEDLDESDDEDLDENFFDEAGDDMMGGDMGDDMTMDIEMPGEEGDMGMDMGDEEGGDVEDRVADLEDELEALKAEFEALMGDEEGEEDHGDMDFGGDEEGEEEAGDEEGEEDSGEEEAPKPFESKKQPMSAGEQMREYVEKVSAKMGDNGVNTKSPMAKPNNMGGTTANIVKGGEGGTGGTQGGLANPSTKDMNTGNVNVPGAKGATKLASQPGHGAEKKGKPESSDKGAGSPLNGAPKRAK